LPKIFVDAEKRNLMNSSERRSFAVWLVWAAAIGCFAALHILHLSADFPNHTLWFSDWAKYTDEGWYGNAAVRAHLFGNWYLRGDFNPAPAVPVWPFLEWILFFFTGVSIEAARGLAVAFFFVNLPLSYLLLRSSGPRWMAMLALTLIVTSPFLYCFSRLAILEPMLIAFTLAALNLAVCLPRLRRPVVASACIGLLYALSTLTKTTAVFLLPVLGWAILVPLRRNRKLALRCGLTAVGTCVAAYGLWMALVVHAGLLRDYNYLFFVNKYPKPPEFYWPLVSFWWALHGTLWVDSILIPLAGLVLLGALASTLFRRSLWGRNLLLDPIFGASILAVAGSILFMTCQNHPQPRYYAVAAFFGFFATAKGAQALVALGGRIRLVGGAVVVLAGLAAVLNGIQTVTYAAHPEYTFVNAARRLTQYVDAHPNGKRLLVSISGDQIALVTHLPSLCDDFGTQDLPAKLAAYQPGWYATWNDFDPGTLEDIHTHFSLEQAAVFRAFDDPQRNRLALFKLHPLPGGQTRDPGTQNLQMPLPDDKIEIPIQ
jgi:hypothetical protein